MHPVMILLGVVVVGIFIFAFVMSRRAKKATYFDHGLAQAETVAKTPALQPTSGEFSGRKRWRQLRTNEIVADVVANATDARGRTSSDDLDLLAHPDNQEREH